MAATADYPLLILPPGVAVSVGAEKPMGGGAPNPRKARQIERLEPAFRELQRVLEGHQGNISSTAPGAAPEHVLVFETNGPTKDFLSLVASTPELEWLIDHDERVEQDDDYRLKKESDSELTSTVYMVLFSEVALQQLLTAWTAYSTKKTTPKAFGAWSKIFRCLRAIRRWGPLDRLREAEMLREVLEPIVPGRQIPVEIELWARAGERRRRAEAQVRALVDAAGGKVLDCASIPEIRYHAILAELPHEYLQRLLNTRDVDLILADDIYLLRPTPQAIGLVDTSVIAECARPPSVGAEGEAVCAVLDGLPMENHPHLQGRLIVDDPDGWSAQYPVKDRRHGTAMASLVIHGDQSLQQPPLTRPIYVRPILRPDNGDERAPRNRLWLDVIHEAVRRLVATDSPNGPVAPNVKVINLSVGDEGRPFLYEPSPLARLLDWLSCKHQVLFIVSAGNHTGALPNQCGDDAAALQHLFDTRRNRRLLSPAELINGLTVGASNHDGSTELLVPPRQAIPQRPDLPAAYSALGAGVRRCVKPDLLAPGGRFACQPRLPMSGADWIAIRNPTVGQLVAIPGPVGARQATYLSGTSNAAALATRAACRAYESVMQSIASEEGTGIRGVPVALILKALVVHSTEWPQEMQSFVANALSGLMRPKHEKDELAAFLGYGVLRPELVVGCNPNRATAIGGGQILANTRVTHRLPIPEQMHLHGGWRRLTATLAWFSPINPGNRKYRAAKLTMSIPRRRQTPLGVEGGQVHGQTATRGTVQHVVLENDSAIMNIGPSDELELVVTCREDAAPLSDPIPYALSVSLEVDSGSKVAVYEGVASRLRVRQPVAVRSHG